MKRVLSCGLVLVPLVWLFASCSPRQEAKQLSDNYRNYYEIFVRSFYDSNGDGMGDLNGVTSKLDYIADDVGADGIWLMPVMPSPSYHKYDVTNYKDIDPQYGTLADFDTLIAEAHKRDIKVIIDLVINHTSSQHPWFTQAVDSLWTGKTSPYTDYYHFTTSSPGQGYRPITDRYFYEARFTSDMPDLNLDSEAVRAEILDITRFWIDRGADGFRLDAVTSYYTGNETKNTDFMKWLGSSVKAYQSDAYFVGEAWTTSAIIEQYYQSGIDSFFNYPFSQYNGTIIQALNAKTGSGFAQSSADWNSTIRQANPAAIDAPFLSNHDNARIAGSLMRSLPKQKMAASLYLLIPGNPFIYYGEEIGMTGSGVDPNKRLPMVWSATDAAGMPQPPPGATQSITDLQSVDAQKKDSRSLLNFYRSVLAVKKQFPAIARGRMTVLTPGNAEVCAYRVDYQGSAVYILHNLSDQSVTESSDALGTGDAKIRRYLLAADLKDQGKPKLSRGMLSLPPLSTVIMQ